MFHLYIITLRDRSHYCGITSRIIGRMLDHSRGRSRSTRGKRPIVLVYLKEFPSMTLARLLEKRIKRQGVTRWWNRYRFSGQA